MNRGMYDLAQSQIASAGYSLKGFVQALIGMGELPEFLTDIAKKYVAEHDAAHQKALDAIGADK